MPPPRAIAVSVLVLALGLRLWELTARSLWMDEAVEYWVAAAPLGDLFATVRDAIQDPPLYSLLLHVWMTPSQHEAWLRLLSVLFGMGSVLGVMVIGHRLHGWTAAIMGGLLMAILPTAVNYSQEASQYAPMLCLVTWSVAVLLALGRETGWRGFMLWGLLAVAAVYTYYGTIITVVVTLGCFLVERYRARDWPRVRRGLWTLGACSLAWLPLAIYFLPRQLHRGPTTRAFEADAGVTPAVLLQNLDVFLKRTIAFQFTGWPCARVPGWLTVTVVLVLLLLVARRQRRMAAWFGATWLVYFLIGVWNLFPFGFRYSLILTPLVVPLVACAAASLAGVRRVAAGAAFAVLCILCVISLPNRSWWQRVNQNEVCLWPETEDLRQVAEYWSQRRRPDQPTYVYYGAVPAFAYYADRAAAHSPTRPAGWFLDCWRGSDAPACHQDNVFYARTVRSMNTQQKMESMLTTMGGRPREFWWIASHTQVGERAAMAKALREEYAMVDLVAGVYATGALMRRRAP